MALKTMPMVHLRLIIHNIYAIRLVVVIYVCLNVVEGWPILLYVTANVAIRRYIPEY